MKQNLVIQLGNAKDVIATLALVEKIAEEHQNEEVWLIIPDEFEPLVVNHPSVAKVILWNNKSNEYYNLKQIGSILKKVKFEYLYNASTSLSAAILAFRIKAKKKIGFKKSGLNAFLNIKISQRKIPAGKNKIEQLLSLLGPDHNMHLPTLHIEKGHGLKIEEPYFLIAPQPDEFNRNYKYLIWEKLLERLPQEFPVYVICNDEKVVTVLKKTRSDINVIAEEVDIAFIGTIIKDAIKVFCAQNIFAFIAATMGANYAVAASNLDYSVEYDLEPEKSIIYTNIAGRREAISLYTALELQKDLNKKYNEQEKISLALKILRDGGIIIHETDTIPGIAANAINSLAIENIYRLKERDTSKAMLILCSDMRMVKDYVHKVPPIVFDLIDASGDDPLTIIYPYAKNLPDNLIAQDGSIGIRIPRSEKLQFLIARHGFPLVSTSANKSGDPAPSDMTHLQEGLLKNVDMVLDIPFKEKDTPMASTIVKVIDQKIEIIRMGKVNDRLRKLLESV